MSELGTEISTDHFDSLSPTSSDEGIFLDVVPIDTHDFSRMFVP